MNDRVKKLLKEVRTSAKKVSFAIRKAAVSAQHKIDRAEHHVKRGVEGAQRIALRAVVRVRDGHGDEALPSEVVQIGYPRLADFDIDGAQ